MRSPIAIRPIVTLTAVTLALGCVTAVAQSPLTLAANAPLPVDLTQEIISDAQKRAGNVTESAGPWGLLESSYVYIAAPDSVLELFPVPSAQTRWTFVGMRRADAAALLDEPDVPARLRAEAADTANWSTVGDHVQFTPSPEAVLALSPQARARIYEVLARWEVNEFHHSPYFVPEGDVVRWIGGTGLRPELIDLVKRTTYQTGRSLCFSDLPLLESVAANASIQKLDIVHVLPPYARKLCYTYPHVSQAAGGRYPDCHWTSLNFFNYRPEERLFDTDGAAMYVRERCDLAAGPYRFGDILFFTTARGHAIHSCVYLADDFVFTKNGANVISPWLIMKLPEVVDRYSVREAPTIQIFRRRE